MPKNSAISDYASLVFDVDGTLVNSVGDITTAMSMTMTDMGYPPLPPGYIMPNLHSTSDIIIADVCNDRGCPVPEDMPAVRAMFYRNYAQFGHNSSTLYPGVREFLDLCAQRGQQLAVCTNKKEDIARQVLSRLGILDHFQAITGCDTYEEPKPSALPLLKTLEQIGGSHEDAIFFGDTHVDAECAQRSQVSFVLHRPGYGSEAASRFPHLLAFDDYAALNI